MAMYGIDVSVHNRGLSLAGTGASFVIVKATDGTRFVDRCCDPFVQEAKRLGLLWGFYHFANGLHKSSMRAQADYFVDNCLDYFGEGVPCLDWEDSDEEYGGAVLDHGPGAAREWLDRVYERTGVRPMVYMNASVAGSYDWSEVARDYALWGAGYPNGSSYDNPGTSRYRWGAWKFPAIHQYSDADGLDRDKAYFESDGWAKFVAGNGKEVELEAHDVWEYNWNDTARCGNMYNCVNYTYDMVQQLLVNETAQTEAIKALTQMHGADPEEVAKAVSDAVEAKLKTIRLEVTTTPEPDAERAQGDAS